MTQEPRQPAKEEILRGQYDAWISQPLTQHLIKRIKELRAGHMDNSIANSYNMLQSDAIFRLNAHAAKTCDTILTAIIEREQLIKD
jgi:hypothetical protein